MGPLTKTRHWTSNGNPVDSVLPSDLRKRTEELNLWECKLEWKKVELNLREDEQNRREEEQDKREEEQQTKDGR